MSDIRLIQGDCLEIMDQLIEEGVKVDAIICDLPYGTTNSKWDIVIPFDELWDRINKVKKDNAAVVLFGAEPFSSYLRLSNIDDYKYDIIWEKSNAKGFQNANKQIMRAHENISVLYKKQCTYNPQKTFGHKLKESNKKKESNSTSYSPNTKDCSYSSTERFPRSVQLFSSDTQTSNYHVNQKPIKLVVWLTDTFCNKGDTVLDMTMGSGTQGVACKLRGMNFIGIEKDKEIFEIAQNRIKNEGNQLSLF